MKKYEYHIVRAKNGDDEEHESLLMSFGREGWKLVSVVREAEATKFYFIRRCEEC